MRPGLAVYTTRNVPLRCFFSHISRFTRRKPGGGPLDALRPWGGSDEIVLSKQIAVCYEAAPQTQESIW